MEREFQNKDTNLRMSKTHSILVMTPNCHAVVIAMICEGQLSFGIVKDPLVDSCSLGFVHSNVN